MCSLANCDFVQVNDSLDLLHFKLNRKVQIVELHIRTGLAMIDSHVI